VANLKAKFSGVSLPKSRDRGGGVRVVTNFPQSRENDSDFLRIRGCVVLKRKGLI